jgi:hypothetical protein
MGCLAYLSSNVYKLTQNKYMYICTPSKFFVGGDVQSYYVQGYNHQDYQYQPPAED